MALARSGRGVGDKTSKSIGRIPVGEEEAAKADQGIGLLPS